MTHSDATRPEQDQSPRGGPGGGRPERAPLDGGALRAALVAPAGPLARLDVVESTGSTNTDVAAAASADPAAWPDLSVLATDFQSAGRGRLERVWQAPPRSSLAVSILFRPAAAGGGALPAAAYGWLSMLCALALAESLEETAGIRASLKWPNDVLAGGRKVAGVLAQLVPAGDAPAVVVGSGVNVSLGRDELPVPTATSLLVEGASTTETTRLLEAYLRAAARLYRGFVADGGDAEAGLRDRVAARMSTLGAPVRAELPGGAVLEGTAVALGADGALAIRAADGTVTEVRAGDVAHLRRADGTYA